MDNITHSLIGLAAGELTARSLKKPRVPLWIASALANNLPDFDVLATSTIFRDKLGYLLHHRGHTHTLLTIPLQAILLLAALWYFWRKKNAIPWKEVIALSFLGVGLHIFADFWNSYGIHPFWPWNNQWVYGDMVFIIEPWIWILLIPPLFFSAESRIGKGLLGLFFCSIVGIAFYHSLVPAFISIAAGIGALFSVGISALLRRHPLLRISVPILFLSLFLLGMRHTRNEAQKTIPQHGELALTPMPANPFCWMAIDSKISGETYSATISTIAPWPTIFTARECNARLGEGFTAPMQIPGEEIAEVSEKQKIIAQFTAPTSELEQLQKNCVANAFLRYARTPFWKWEKNGFIIGDLRFDRDRSVSFGELFVSQESSSCPSFLPPWEGRFWKQL